MHRIPLGPAWMAGTDCRALAQAVALLCCAALSGCAALSNPVADAVPVNRLPQEVLGRPKADERPIPLPLLRQKPPAAYVLAPGDVLGVYIENILGERTVPPPVRVPETGNVAPSTGFPIPVRADGTISLPLIEPLKVEGLTVSEAQQAVLKAYTVTREILKPGSERIIVSLARPRLYHILVVRQDTGGQAIVTPALPPYSTGAAPGTVGQTKRGAGFAVDLPAYENDVLNALARTGGLPGLDAKNEVIIQRGSFKPGTDLSCAAATFDPTAYGIKTIRIPLRLRPGEEPPFRPADVILNDGDIVFIEARDTEFFYTGGLLPPHQFIVPRDYDLDVVQAVTLAQGPLINGGQNLNNLSGNVLQAGIGFPSPSLITILRRTADGGQIPIRVSLNKALRDPRERVLVQPGDLIILQQTMDEALGQYFTAVFRLNLLGTIIRQNDLLGTTTLSVP